MLNELDGNGAFVSILWTVEYEDESWSWSGFRYASNHTKQINKFLILRFCFWRGSCSSRGRRHKVLEAAKKTAAHTLLFLPPSFGVFLVFTSSSHALAQQPVVPVLSRGTFLISGSDFLGSQTYNFKANCQNKSKAFNLKIFNSFLLKLVIYM